MHLGLYWLPVLASGIHLLHFVPPMIWTAGPIVIARLPVRRVR